MSDRTHSLHPLPILRILPRLPLIDHHKIAAVKSPLLIMLKAGTASFLDLCSESSTSAPSRSQCRTNKSLRNGRVQYLSGQLNLAESFRILIPLFHLNKVKHFDIFIMGSLSKVMAKPQTTIRLMCLRGNHNWNRASV